MSNGSSRLAPLRPNTLDVRVLDGFRGLAVLWIILGHCWNELGGKIRLDHGPVINVFVSSYTGVDMLFIVSGFVLFLPVVLRGDLGDRRDYALRRAARIVPAFYAALVLSFVISRAIGVGATPWSWLTHALFVHTEAHDVHDLGFGTNGAMWTMSVEVLFYAALPLVATWYRRRPWLGLLIAVAAAEAWHMLAVYLPEVLEAVGLAWAGVADGQERMALAFPSYLGHFAAGMTAAWLYVQLRERIRPQVALAVQAASAVIVLVILYSRGLSGLMRMNGPLDHWVKTLDRVIFFTLLVLATALGPKLARWPFENRAVRLMGIACYGAYLVHLPLIMLLIDVLGLQRGTTANGDLFLLAAIATPVSILIGLLSYAFLEEPVRRAVRRRNDPLTQADVALSPIEA